ncbi:MAG: Inner membrane protein YebE [Pseudomonas citronellolis]|nr:MAG: Inner membrane protein YebE [Pseudomonas citronellolis]
MNTRGLLDQLLKSGQDLLQNKGLAQPDKAGQGGKGLDLGGLLSGAGGGALAAGALGLLMGSKKARKVGGQVITYGGLAALGVIAYKAYGNWQRQQASAPRGEPQTVDRVAEPQVEQHSQAILLAIVAAAKADGHIDARERQLIDGEVAKLTQDRALQTWLEQELAKPLDPADVARAAGSEEIAAEMYLASLLMVDERNFMERAYLDELARQLSLDPGLKAELEAQASQALENPIA